jgi:hypothetical protein
MLPLNFSHIIYKELHEDLKNFTNIELENHYLLYGIYEGRYYNFNCYKDYEGVKKQYNLNTPSNFNYFIYKNIHSDLENFTNEDLEFHYYLSGKKEGRIYNFNCYKDYNGIINSYDNLNIPTDFDVKKYKSIYSDVKNFTDDEAKIHYFLFGKNENRQYKLPDFYNNKLYRKILKNNINNLSDTEINLDYIIHQNDPVINYLMQDENETENINIEEFSENVFITFIIPTIGRLSLINTINSLLNLNNKNWQALIIFDGIINQFCFDDIRIKYIEIEKRGNKYENTSNAGYVRNIGINHIQNTEWFAFVDDDDCISPLYIDNLLFEINLNNNFDVCIFRMIYDTKKIIPSPESENIILDDVGINFAIKKNIIKKYKFTNSNCEDYLLLKKLELNNIKIIISPFITYYVRTNLFEIEENQNIPRILINI